MRADARALAHINQVKIYKVQKYARQMYCASCLNLTEIQQSALLFLSVCNNLLNRFACSLNAVQQTMKAVERREKKKQASHEIIYCCWHELLVYLKGTKTCWSFLCTMFFLFCTAGIECAHDNEQHQILGEENREKIQRNQNYLILLWKSVVKIIIL